MTHECADHQGGHEVLVEGQPDDGHAAVDVNLFTAKMIKLGLLRHVGKALLNNNALKLYLH